MTSSSGVVQLHEKLGFPHSELPTNWNQFRKCTWDFLQTLQECKPVDATMLVNLQPEVHVKINKVLFCWSSPPPTEHCSHLVKKWSSIIFLLTGTRRCCPEGMKGTKGNWLSRGHCQLSQSMRVATYAYIFFFLTCNSYSCNAKTKRKMWALSCLSWNARHFCSLKLPASYAPFFLFRKKAALEESQVVPTFTCQGCDIGKIKAKTVPTFSPGRSWFTESSVMCCLLCHVSWSKANSLARDQYWTERWYKSLGNWNDSLTLHSAPHLRLCGYYIKYKLKHFVLSAL